MENQKHYFSDEACAKCGGRIRYKSTKNCVPCLKLSVAKRRAQIAALVDTADNHSAARTASPATHIDPLSDLLGDINAPHR